MVKERAGMSVDELIANRFKDRFQVTWFDDVDQSAVCTENLNTSVVVMKSAQDGA
jgi:hypothetical protein